MWAGKRHRFAAARKIIFAVAAAVAIFAVPSNRALSQVDYPTHPVVLVDVDPTSSPDGKAGLLLTFSPSAPTFSIIKNETDHPAIAFALSSRGTTARSPLDNHNLVRAIAFEQQDTILIVRLTTAKPVHISATAVGDKGIRLNIEPLQRTADRSHSGLTPSLGPPRASMHDDRDDGFEVVPLKYADVSEVVGLLTQGSVKPNDAFSPREPAFGSAGMGGATYTPGPPPTNEPSDEPMAQTVDEMISVDRRLNAIILHGPRDLMARIKEKIILIDVPVESVSLETIFVELSETGAKNVGLDFANANGQLAVTTFQTGAFVPFGLDKTHVASASMQAAIYAQVQSGQGRVVSKPRISAQSGSSAKIVTGDALPILTAIQLSGVNGVSQQVQYVNVGVTLQIAPRVSRDGFVTSHVFCVVSSVTGFSQGYPTISQREAETSATVNDGETFVIGGLTQENEIQSDTRIPLLGRIPLIGGVLFGVEKGSDIKTELYIVVTPHVIVRSPVTAASTPTVSTPMMAPQEIAPVPAPVPAASRPAASSTSAPTPSSAPTPLVAPAPGSSSIPIS